MDEFQEGEYIIYVNGDVNGRYELGRIKSLHPDGAFVAYHEGSNGSKTPYDCMHKLVNAYTIKETSIAQEYFNTSEDIFIDVSRYN